MQIRTHIYTGTDAQNSLGNSNTKWLLNGKNVKEILEVEITLSSADGTTKTVYDNAITSKHVVLESIICDPTGTIIE